MSAATNMNAANHATTEATDLYTKELRVRNTKKNKSRKALETARATGVGGDALVELQEANQRAFKYHATFKANRDTYIQNLATSIRKKAPTEARTEATRMIPGNPAPIIEDDVPALQFPQGDYAGPPAAEAGLIEERRHQRLIELETIRGLTSAALSPTSKAELIEERRHQRLIQLETFRRLTAAANAGQPSSRSNSGTRPLQKRPFSSVAANATSAGRAGKPRRRPKKRARRPVPKPTAISYTITREDFPMQDLGLHPSKEDFFKFNGDRWNFASFNSILNNINARCGSDHDLLLVGYQDEEKPSLSQLLTGSDDGRDRVHVPFIAVHAVQNDDRKKDENRKALERKAAGKYEFKGYGSLNLAYGDGNHEAAKKEPFKTQTVGMEFDFNNVHTFPNGAKAFILRLRNKGIRGDSKTSAKSQQAMVARFLCLRSPDENDEIKSRTFKIYPDNDILQEHHRADPSISSYISPWAPQAEIVYPVLPVAAAANPAAAAEHGTSESESDESDDYLLL